MKKLILVAATLASLAPAAAVADSTSTATYTVVPLPAPDTRNKFMFPSGAVFIVNQTTDTITMCFPDTDKNNNNIVSCTDATDLPK